MKKMSLKLLSLLLALCMAFISGCTSSEYTSDGEKAIALHSERGSVRLARIKDELYYDTGDKWDSSGGRCGTMDASLVKGVGEYEIPTENGTTNFDGADGAQLSANDRYCIPIEGEDWREFRRVDTDKDISGYKYCVYLKGTMPHAERESEYIAFTNDKDLTFYSAMGAILTYMNHEEPDDVILLPVKYGQVYDWGLEMKAENVTPTGLWLVFNQSGGDVTGDLQTGEYYCLDTFKDGRWQSAAKREGSQDMAWHMIAYGINKNGETRLDVDWTWLYGELEPGRYRIGKQITDFREAGDMDTWMYYAEFAIE